MLFAQCFSSTNACNLQSAEGYRNMSYEWTASLSELFVPYNLKSRLELAAVSRIGIRRSTYGLCAFFLSVCIIT